MIIHVTAPVYLLIASYSITFMYLVSLPLSGEIFDIDSISNLRIGLPLDETHECNVSSEINMSLRLAYASGVVSIVLSALLTLYNITPKQGQAWSVTIVWMTSLLAFICQIIVFIIITSRISVWFLSCNNPSKIAGACPTTRYEKLKGPITDKEMCNFNPLTLTLKNDESDLFVDCLNTETFKDYTNSFARYDISSYYTASALCLRNETSIGNDLSFCFYWGCSKLCSPDTYYLNLKWFTLDCVLLVAILVAYIVILAEFYIEKGYKSA